MKKFLLFLQISLILFSAAFTSPSIAPLITKTIYDDALGSGWDNWSWATVNLSATNPIHSGSHSIAVTFGPYQGLYLHKAGLDTLGTSFLRFFIHGGSSGGQHLSVYFNLDVNGQPQNGPGFAVPPPQAGAWSEVQAPLSALNPANAAITGITWQESQGASDATLYMDDIVLVSNESPAAPQLSVGALLPRSAPADGLTAIIVRANVSDPQGLADLAFVTLDASSLGRGLVTLQDDGCSNDGQYGDGVYGAALTIAPSTPPGERKLVLTAQDREGHTSALPLGAFNVLDSPGGAIPLVLPQRFGWGSNTWSETPGQDWQVNSGVPWNYVYQYITYNWETWGENFVLRFVHQAWDKNYIPMVTVYMVLGTPPDCGEASTCYAQKLQNSSFVQAYLASLLRAAQQANGAKPVIFNLEPDFYGYMQQLSNDPDNRPAGVRPDDPTSYPVALNISGYPNTLAGFGRRLADLIHAAAPNALVAPMASMWATNGDPQGVTDSEAMDMARRTAAFIDAMGGAQSDLLIVEWGDRDAGSGLRPWWDDTDQEAPRPTRAVLWENALSHAAARRLLLWQIPVGNRTLDNTCEAYQDNRAAYAFSHPRDLFDAGVAGLLFGGGATCMTGVNTDGGFVAAQGAIAYAAPAIPTGLAAGVLDPVTLLVRWNESSEPDRWGYRVHYRLGAQGAPLTVDAGRRNSLRLALPGPGTWQISLSAYDAMGSESLVSAPVLVATGQEQAFIPLLRH